MRPTCGDDVWSRHVSEIIFILWRLLLSFRGMAAVDCKRLFTLRMIAVYWICSMPKRYAMELLERSQSNSLTEHSLFSTEWILDSRGRHWHNMSLANQWSWRKMPSLRMNTSRYRWIRIVHSNWDVISVERVGPFPSSSCKVHKTPTRALCLNDQQSQWNVHCVYCSASSAYNCFYLNESHGLSVLLLFCRSYSRFE